MPKRCIVSYYCGGDKYVEAYILSYLKLDILLISQWLFHVRHAGTSVWINDCTCVNLHANGNVNCHQYIYSKAHNGNTRVNVSFINICYLYAFTHNMDKITSY